MSILPFTLLGFGFLLGIKHALDADHIAAISTMISKDRTIKEASLLGMFWGLGHTIALLAIGLVILLLKISIPEKLALSFELIVGIMLLILGINLAIQIVKDKVHIHRHKHGTNSHLHFHSHKYIRYHHNHTHKSLYIGILHGLAGSAVLSLLVLSTINSIWLGLLYILIFGAGSILGMMLISSIISIPFTLIPARLENTKNALKAFSALISIFLGLSIIYKIGLGGLL